MAGSRETVQAREAAPPSPVPVSSPAEANLFSRVSVGRISEIIVEQIRLLMRQGQLKPGDRLPPNGTYASASASAGSPSREALRTLESSGLVEIRVGARGGAFVTVPSSDRVGEGLADLLTLSVISAADVTEIRMILETGMSLSSVRGPPGRTWPTWSASANGRRRRSDGDYSMDLSREFHIRVAQATHNPAVVMLIESFRGPLLMSLQQDAGGGPGDGHPRHPGARAVH